MDRSIRDILEYRIVREEIELLEHQSEISLDLIQFCVRNIVGSALRVRRDGGFAHIGNLTCIDCLEECRAAKKRTFTRTGRTDDADDLAGIDIEADIF